MFTKLPSDKTAWQDYLIREFYTTVPNGTNPYVYYKTLSSERDKLINFLIVFELICNTNDSFEKLSHLMYKLFIENNDPEVLIKEITAEHALPESSLNELKQLFCNVVNYFLSSEKKYIELAVALGKSNIKAILNGPLAYRIDNSEYEGKQSPDRTVYDLLSDRLLIALFNTEAIHLTKLIFAQQPSLVNYENQNRTSLQIAVMSMKPKMVELVLNQGGASKINKKTECYDLNCTDDVPLVLALKNILYKDNEENKQMVKLLLDHGANPDQHSCGDMWIGSARGLCTKLLSDSDVSLSASQKATINFVLNWQENIDNHGVQMKSL